MTKHAKKPESNLPVISLDNHVIEAIAHWFDHNIRTGDSHSFLRRLMRKLVRDGQMPLRRLIEYTSDQNWAQDADAALRDMAEEMFERGEELPKLLTAYLISHPKPTRGRGRRETDTLLRDQCVAACVAIAIERWSVVMPITRDPDVTDAPSICSCVSKVCRARGISIGEKRVKQIYDRFAEFLPMHQGWLAIKSNSPN